MSDMSVADHQANQQKEQAILACLSELGITTETHHHAPIFTVEEGHHLHAQIPGGHCKTLFLKDKNAQYLLVVMLGDQRLDMKALQKSDQLPTKRLSFASAERMQNILGVSPGSVTPFCLMNVSLYMQDNDLDLTVVLDKHMMDHDQLNYHPLHNGATTTIAREDLLKFIRHFGFEPVIMDFKALS